MAELKERVAVTEEEISRYLAHLRAMGRPEGTIQTYRLGLDRLYQSLPEDKEVGPDTLHWWQGALLEAGYSPSTVNTWLSVAASIHRPSSAPVNRRSTGTEPAAESSTGARRVPSWCWM